MTDFHSSAKRKFIPMPSSSSSSSSSSCSAPPPALQLPISRHFFKIMVPGFHTQLNLPPDFSLKLKGEEAVKGALTSKKGSWNVEIGRSDKDAVWFGKGWEEFVQSHNLAIGDFAVFEHLDHLNFNVTLLDACGCEKKLELAGTKVIVPQVKPVDSKKEKRKLNGDEPFNQYVKGSSEFMAKIKGYNIRKRSPYMHIPVEFCQSNEIFHNTTIRLTGPSGKSCPVNLKICYGGKTLYACLTSGWREFFSSNTLKVGDVCIFRLDPTKSDSESIAMDVMLSICSEANADASNIEALG